MATEYTHQQTIVLGCFNNELKATEEYPLSLGEPGTEVFICALNIGVAIKFTGNDTPFVGVVPNQSYPIPQGTFLKWTVKDQPRGTRFNFKPTALPPSTCGGSNAGPEMIVP